ncbi:MAG: NAD-dependent epimerase/dehydratase [Flavobacteriaceae bacterium]|nr:NAD-dependent epimerase/dehydratase [Flavobacteriaceae bacterium]
MKVLLTGGAGYIGYSLVNLLEQISEIEEITVFDNLYRNNTHFFTEGRLMSKTKFVKGDILNLYELEKVIKNQDVVIHMAAYVEFPYSYQDNYKFEQVNHYGTVVLFNLLEKYPAQKVINLSSAAVYGFSENAVESSATSPANFYAASKINAERYLDILSSKSQVYHLRLANVFGYNPMIRLDSVINRFMFEGLLYHKIKIHGSGNQFRPFISLDTVIQQIADFVIKNPSSGIYNLVEFNQNMNFLRDFVMEKIPELEFAYLNSNQEFKTLTMHSEKLNITQDATQILDKSFKYFKEKMRL